MKKSLLITLIIGLAVIIAGLSVYYTRNQLTAYLIRHEVQIQSKGKVSIDFNQVQLDIFSKQLVFYQPTLKFKGVFVNKDDSILLSQTSFRKITISNIALWPFIKRKLIICESLEIEKPDFVLQNPDALKLKRTSSFDPGIILDILEKHKIASVGFQFLIKKTQIDFGKIELVQGHEKEEYGSTRYKITINNLGTPLKTVHDSLNMVTYGQLEVKISGLKRHSIKNNFEFKIDSAHYNSFHKHFIVDGFHFKTLNNKRSNKASVEVNINWADFVGLHLNDLKPKAKEIHFGTLKLIGGTFTIVDGDTLSNSQTKPDKWYEALQDYKLLTFDTLLGKHIHIYQLKRAQDTLLILKRLNFTLNHTRISRDFIKNPFQKIRFDKFDFSLAKIKTRIQNQGILLQTNNISYDYDKKLLAITWLSTVKKSEHLSMPDTLFTCRNIRVNNFLLERFQHTEDLLLDIDMLDPYLQLKAVSNKNNIPTRTFSKLLKTIKIRHLRTRHGKFQLLTKANHFNLYDIDLFIDGLKSDLLLQKRPRLEFDTLFVEADSSNFTAYNGHQTFSTSQIKWQGNKFTLNHLRYFQDSAQLTKVLFIPSIIFTHLKINQLFFHKKLYANGASFYKPDLTLFKNDSPILADTNQSLKSVLRHFPIKIYWNNLRIEKGSLSYRHQADEDSLTFSTNFDIKWHKFTAGYNNSLSGFHQNDISILLNHLQFSNDQFYGTLAELQNDNSGDHLILNNLEIGKPDKSNDRFRLRIPRIIFNKVDLLKLATTDTIAFNSMLLIQPDWTADISSFQKPSVSHSINLFTALYDSLKIKQANFKLFQKSDSTNTSISGEHFDLFYHPNFRHPQVTGTTKDNLLKKWDFSLRKLVYNDTLKHIKIIADQVELQSNNNKLSLHHLIGTNFSNEMTNPGRADTYGHLQLEDMQWSGLSLSGHDVHNLHINQIEIPHLWLNLLNEHDPEQMKSRFSFSSMDLASAVPFLNSIHIDSSFFKDVNLSYHYEHRRKLIKADHIGIYTDDIHIGTPIGKNVDKTYLFTSMLIDLNGKTILSGDSLYSFHTKDIRIDLPLKRISLDSLSIKPMLQRNNFFKKSVYQTDRVTLYGKQISFYNFDLNNILATNRLDFGRLQFDHFNVLFERDKSYPLADIVKPLPIDHLQQIPFKFYIDSIQLQNSQISYYEYNAKSRQPGIFFIDNFDIHALNVTNDISHIDSNLVLKFYGTGRIMKQSDLSFALVMPYYAPNHQFWFSGHTGPIDLSQFNSLTQNTMGIGVISGKGNIEIPYVTGNDTFVKGNMFFLYRNLKLRLYNRKKAQMNKGIGSPFVNFMLNNLMIRSNNSSFLKHPRKGIIFYERDPRKSFINYIWKSSLSGILSTMGFNNKQQRQGKREDKKASRQKK